MVIALAGCGGGGASTSQATSDVDLGSWCSVVAELEGDTLVAGERIALLDRLADEAPSEVASEVRVVVDRTGEALDGVDRSDPAAITEALVTLADDSEVRDASDALEAYVDDACDPPADCDPRVELTVTPGQIERGGTVSIHLAAAAGRGIEVAWWYIERENAVGIVRREEIRPGGAVQASKSWDVTLPDAGTYVVTANNRDVTEGAPMGTDIDEIRRPKQASEGCGLAEATIVVS